MTAPAAPSALKHGLASRWAAEARQEECEALAPLLVGAARPTPDVMDAARAAAEAILHLKDVRALKAAVLGEAEQIRPGELDEQARTIGAYFPEALESLYAADGSRVTAWFREGSGVPEELEGSLDLAAAAMLDHMDRHQALLARIDDYERRALSRRAKAIRELDLARIDAERKPQPAST